MKFKKYLILVIILIFVIILFSYLRTNYIKKIKYENYNEIVSVKKDTNLYKRTDKKYEVIGSIKKNTKIYLDKINIKENYFKLKDTDYYINYKDVEKTKDDIKKNTNYILFDEVVITNDNFSLDNKININEKQNLQILIKDELYYVLFNNSIYSINKKDVKKIEKTEKSNNYTDSISVLNFKNDLNIEKIVKYISENNYLTLTMDDYIMWSNDQINLPENSILLITKENINKEILKNNNIILNDNFDEEFKINNQVSDKNNKNSYEINNTSIDNLKKILNKEVIIYDKATSIPVLNYHFFFDSSKNEKCNEIICLEIKKFREHLDYLKNNNYKTLTLTEFNDWMDGKIELPKKSVLITIDDGAMGTSFINGNLLIPTLEEYDMKATLFLITSWWDSSNYKSDNLEVESHGHDIHMIGKCGTQQIKCLNYNQLYTDIETSMNTLNSNKAFCYPFYINTDDSIKALKQLGFKMAFGGGGYNATRKSNKYFIPRYPIFSDITMNEFKRIVN